MILLPDGFQGNPGISGGFENIDARPLHGRARQIRMATRPVGGARFTNRAGSGAKHESLVKTGQKGSIYQVKQTPMKPALAAARA